jgi:AcrR family transcriptional regulator
VSTRDRMLDAAAHVMRTRGLARATTKEIAKAAGYSEAALYKHFRDKTDIFLAVLAERVPGTFSAVLANLAERIGEGCVQDTLAEIARAALGFYHETFVMAASVFAEPRLLAAHRAAVRERDAGPHHISDTVANYIEAEQNRGRLRVDADPRAAANLLLGACFQHAFLNRFADATMDDKTAAQTAAALSRTLFRGLAPEQP